MPPAFGTTVDSTLLCTACADARGVDIDDPDEFLAFRAIGVQEHRCERCGTEAPAARERGRRWQTTPTKRAAPSGARSGS